MNYRELVREAARHNAAGRKPRRRQDSKKLPQKCTPERNLTNQETGLVLITVRYGVASGTGWLGSHPYAEWVHSGVD